MPAYCLGDYFRLLLSRRRLDPGMDAESFLAWATAPGRERACRRWTFPPAVPTQGGDYALDVVDRSLDLLDRLTDPDPDLDGVRLQHALLTWRVRRQRKASTSPRRGEVRVTNAPVGGASAHWPRSLRGGRPGDSAGRRRSARWGRHLAGDRRRRSGHGAEPCAVGRGLPRPAPGDGPPSYPAGPGRPRLADRLGPHERAGRRPALAPDCSSPTTAGASRHSCRCPRTISGSCALPTADSPPR